MSRINMILDEAASLLETARFGLVDMRGHAERRRSGLRNAVIFGRNATWALQNLRGKAFGFEEWYQLVQENLRSDPLARFFHDLRTTIEKRADTPVGARVSVGGFSSDILNDISRRAPPGAKTFFIGD